MNRLLALILTFGLFAATAFAHNGEQHIMGTVISVSDTEIAVKAADGTTKHVMLTKDTKYLRISKSITAHDLMAGDHVVIHAMKEGATFKASEVKAGKMDMKGMKGDMNGMKMDGKTKPQ